MVLLNFENKLDKDDILKMILSDDYFKNSSNCYFDNEIFSDKDFGSIFRANSSSSSLLDNNLLKENFYDFDPCCELYQKENHQKRNRKNLDTLNIILQIKTLFYNKQFDEIFDFFTQNFPSVNY
jgi:hypothetical protein